jgi:hypothetical protein
MARRAPRAMPGKKPATTALAGKVSQTVEGEGVLEELLEEPGADGAVVLELELELEPGAIVGVDVALLVVAEVCDGEEP